MQKDNTKSIESFANDPIAKVVIKNSIPALLASIIRQAVIFIPAMFILQEIFGASGLIWAQPVADVLSLIVVAVMLAVKIKKMDTENNK